MDNYSRAMTRPGSAAHVDIDTFHNLYPHQQVGSLNLRASQAFVKNSQNQVISYQPTTNDANALKTAGSYTDFRLLSGHIIKTATIHLTVRNETAANIPWPTRRHWHFSPIDRVEILGEGGSLLIQRLDREALCQKVNLLTPNALDHMLGSSNDATSAVMLEVDGMGEAYYPLFGAIFEHTLCLAALNSPIVVRVYWAGAAGWTMAVAPTMVSCTLVTEQDKLAQREHQELVQSLRSGPPSDIRFNRQTFQRMTEHLEPNSRYVFPLTSVAGLVTSLHISLRTTTTRMPGPSHKFQTLDILSGSGVSMLGGTPVSANYVKLVRAIMRENERNDAEDGWLPITFTDDSANHENSGILSGYMVFDNTMQLAVTTPSTLPAGSYEIYVLVNRVACLRQAGGTLSIMES